MWTQCHGCGDDGETRSAFLDALSRLFENAAMNRFLRIAAAALVIGCATSGPSRLLYQWTDASGSVRYTSFPDRVPSARLHTRRIIEPGASAFQNGAAELPPLPAAALPRSVPPDASPLDTRIAALEAQVAADEEALKLLISDPKAADTLRSSPELREIGGRLPALQAELAELRAERASKGDGS